MNENIQKMLELLSQDEENMKKLAAIRDPDEAYALVTSIHGGYTKEEFIEAMTALNEQINQDIDVEDLSKVAGGDASNKVVTHLATGAVLSAAGTVTVVSAAAGIGTAISAAGVSASIGVMTGCASAAAV